MVKPDTSANPSSATESVPWVLAGLAIDYFRWTQLVPMITAWAFLLVMIGAMLLASFQQQSFSLIQWGATTYERFLGPIENEAVGRPDSDLASTSDEAESGATTFSDEDFMPWVLRAWGVVALAGWLLGLLRGLIFGPRAPMGLKRKLVLAAIAAAACVAMFAFAYFFGSEEFHGSAVGWALMFTGFPLGVWLVSAYSLTVAHGLDSLRARLLESA